jgi:hypothetical protein
MHEILKIENKIYTIKNVFNQFLHVKWPFRDHKPLPPLCHPLSIWINLTIYIAVLKYYVNTRDFRTELFFSSFLPLGS